MDWLDASCSEPQACGVTLVGRGVDWSIRKRSRRLGPSDQGLAGHLPPRSGVGASRRSDPQASDREAPLFLPARLLGAFGTFAARRKRVSCGGLAPTPQPGASPPDPRGASPSASAPPPCGYAFMLWRPHLARVFALRVHASGHRAVAVGASLIPCLPGASACALLPCSLTYSPSHLLCSVVAHRAFAGRVFARLVLANRVVPPPSFAAHCGPCSLTHGVPPSRSLAAWVFRAPTQRRSIAATRRAIAATCRAFSYRPFAGGACLRRRPPELGTPAFQRTQRDRQDRLVWWARVGSACAADCLWGPSQSVR
jgi:hypothetical protein